MIRLFCSILLAITAFPLNAQVQTSQDEMRAIVQKVDSLEHELSYLKLSYELETLYTDMTIFSNEMYGRATDIRLMRLSGNYDSELAESYEGYYNSCKRKKQSIDELADIKKKNATLAIMYYPYTEDEFELLIRRLKMLDYVSNVVDDTLIVLRESLNAYQKSK